MKRIVVLLACLAAPAGLMSPGEPLTARPFALPELRPLSVGESDAVEPWAGIAAGRIRPIALASGDFDEDGMPDLVAGYAGVDQSYVTLHRGNVDALFPHGPGARRRKAEGRFVDQPFLTPPTVFEAPVAPDFLGAGDFNNDGALDVVIGSRGGIKLHLLAGDGEGELHATETVELSGSLSAMAVGEVNRRDGLTDLMVGVRGADGFEVHVFQGPRGAMRSEAEVLQVPAEPSALLPARLSDGPWRDLAVAAGSDLIIVRGRDRKLILGDELKAEVGPPVVQRFEQPAEIESLAWGDFVLEATLRRELALLLEDGTLRLLSGAGEPLGRRELVAPRRGAAVSAMLPVRISGSPTDDLAVLDAQDERLLIVAGMRHDGIAETGGVAAADLTDRPTAVLPMRLNPDALTDLVLLQNGVEAPALIETRALATITVDTALDVAAAGDGLCSLREAINNSTFDTDTTSGDCVAGSGVDTIGFSIGGGGATATIALASALPVVASAATIDGTTQGCASPPCVALDGFGAGVVFAGLHLSGGSSTVRGMVIHGIQGTEGIVDGLGIFVDSDNNFVEGNHIATDLTGTVALENEGASIRIEEGASNTVGGTVSSARNLLSGGGVGVLIADALGTTDNLVVGNFFGTDVTGAIALGSRSSGVVIRTQSNTVGGTTAGSRNIISGTGGNGIYCPNTSSDTLILGNYVGIDLHGTTALGNGENNPGVWVSGPNNTVGGTSPAARNLISGNVSNGVHLDPDATGSRVSGNFIGTDASGTADVGNRNHGIRVDDSPNNVLGGAVPWAGNVVSGNGAHGIYIEGAEASGNKVLGNLVGTDSSGTAGLGNGFAGVRIESGANNAVGGTTPGAGNLLSANGANGIALYVTTGNEVFGNFVGTDITGAVSLPNQWHGIALYSTSTNNTIGGTAPRAGNVISGNLQDGVAILGENTIGNAILGNLIGTDVTGTQPLGNGWNGVELQSTGSNTIGGSEAGARNIISASQTYNGIHMNEVTGVIVQGNFIGTDVTGTVDLGNAGVGIRTAASSDLTIGGPNAGEGNLIAGNSFYGVDLDGTSTSTVAGNIIGLQIDGTTPMGNQLHGVLVRNGGQNNTIGGTGVTPGRCDGPCNRIGFVASSGADGVCVEGSGAYNTVLGNSIHSCGGLGIDLGNDGVTPNDLTDPDIGANNLQNYPELSLAEATPAGLTVSGSLNSRPNQQYRVEFYASSSCDDSGHGEGAIYLGHHSVTTDGSGDAIFTVPTLAGVSNGDAITTTATSVIFSSPRDTSEFSACMLASCLSIAEFGQTLLAPDRASLTWSTPDDVRFVKGPLARVAGYRITAAGDLPEATSLDISSDTAPSGDGFYYLVRPVACGSWQTGVGAQPDRDTALP